MITLEEQFRKFFAVLSGVLFFTVISMSDLQAEVLATFNDSTEDWKGYEGPVEQVSTPDGKRALQISVALSGQGWSDITVESPELEEDFSKHKDKKLRMSVFAPENAPRDIKAQVFTKSGANSQWKDGGWQLLSKEKWKVVTLPISHIPHPDKIQWVGIKIGGNSHFKGVVFLDIVEVK